MPTLTLNTEIALIGHATARAVRAWAITKGRRVPPCGRYRTTLPPGRDRQQLVDAWIADGSPGPWHLYPDAEELRCLAAVLWSGALAEAQALDAMPAPPPGDADAVRKMAIMHETVRELLGLVGDTCPADHECDCESCSPITQARHLIP